jgi:hypothetical protein
MEVGRIAAGGDVKSAQYAYISRFSSVWRGRRVEDHALPGDENQVLALTLKRILDREQWYNPQELEVYVCTRAQLWYGIHWCFNADCGWCANNWDQWP